MERIKLPGVTEEDRAVVREAVERELYDEEIRLKNRRLMLIGLINKKIFGKPAVAAKIKARRRARGKVAKASRKVNR